RTVRVGEVPSSNRGAPIWSCPPFASAAGGISAGDRMRLCERRAQHLHAGLGGESPKRLGGARLVLELGGALEEPLHAGCARDEHESEPRRRAARVLPCVWDP